MGGKGSGRYPDLPKKRVVENSIVLNAAKLQPTNRPREIALRSVGDGRIMKARFEYLPLFPDPTPRIKVTYTVEDGKGKAEEVQQAVILDFSMTGTGGRRTWFRCSGKESGTTCGNRTLKLYLPVEEKLFACRRCHQLVYAKAIKTRPRFE